MPAVFFLNDAKKLELGSDHDLHRLAKTLYLPIGYVNENAAFCMK